MEEPAEVAANPYVRRKSKYFLIQCQKTSVCRLCSKVVLDVIL